MAHWFNVRIDRTENNILTVKSIKELESLLDEFGDDIMEIDYIQPFARPWAEKMEEIEGE